MDELIAAGEGLTVELAGGQTSSLALLGQTTRDFFSTYRSLSVGRGGFFLSSANVKPSEYLRGCLSIGHSEDWDVVQQPGSDEVLVVEGSEKNAAEADVRFPSVYHLVLDELNRRNVEPPSS